MKFGKKLLILLLAIISVACFAFSAACSKEEEPAPASNWEAVELNTDFTVPLYEFPGLTEEELLDGTVTYRFVSPLYEDANGKMVRKEYKSFFPTVYCDVVGTWTVYYECGNKSIGKTFKVVDSVKPDIVFKETPYDVWVGERYFVPEVEVNDVSGLKEVFKENHSVKLYVDESDENYDPENPVIDLPLNDLLMYRPTATGRIVYTITISDVWGNVASASTEWNVKDPEWTDTALEEGFVADYDQSGYINTVESGYVSSYWTGSEIRETYHETFEGANGVLQITAAPNKKALGTFKFNLMKPITQEDLVNKSMMIKIYTTNKIDYVLYGCEKDQGGSIGMAHAFKINVTPNEWNYIVLPTSQLKYGYFDLEDEEIDSFHICFGGNGANDYKMSEDCVIYIDSVTLVEKLDNVELSVSGNQLSWQAIPNATGYEVIDGDTTTKITDTTYTITDSKAKIGVRALAENSVLFIAQDNYTPFVDMSAFEEDDLALFNTASYELLATKNSSKGTTREAHTLTAEYLESFNGVDNVLKVTTTNNNVLNPNGIGDVVINLPKACASGLTLKFMCTKSDATAIRFIQPGTEYGWDGVADITVSETEWKTVYIDYTKKYGFNPDIKDRIEIMVQGGEMFAENVFYFALVKDGDKVMDLELGELKESLKDGELAMYDHAKYTMTVIPGYSPHSGSLYNVKSEYLASYEGKSGVMKIDVQNNPGGDQGSDGKFTLKLLAPHTGTYTIRYRIEVADGDTATSIMVPTSSAGNEDSNAYSLTEDVWHTKAYTTNSPVKDEIVLYNFTAGAKFTIYVDGVWDGDKVSEVELADAIASLKDGELASYNSASYVYTLDSMYSSWQGTDFNVKASYLDSYEGATGVLKIDVVNDKDGNSAWFNLKLLKAHEGTYTIKYRIEVPEGGKASGIITPMAYNEKDVASFTYDNPSGIPITNNIWHTECITTTSTIKDYIVLYNYGAGANFTIYIDGIWLGDTTANS